MKDFKRKSLPLSISIYIFTFILLLSACSYDNVDNPAQQRDLAPNPAASAAQAPLLKNDTGKTVIQRVSHSKVWSSDFVIISRKGTVVYIDPYEVPQDITNALPPSILCVTHMSHVEHFDANMIELYQQSNHCRISLETQETFQVDDVKVTGIKSSHGLVQSNFDHPTNHNIIYVFEVDGLRIAAFGGFGQAALSEKQKQLLGQIDIALVSFGIYGEMDLIHSFNLIQSLQPSMVIPTHIEALSDDVLSALDNIMGACETIENILILDSAAVKDTRKAINLVNTLYP